MDLQAAISKVIAREDLSASEMEEVMDLIMTGQATDAQIGGFLIGMRMKGETVPEITAAAKVMRALSEKVNLEVDHMVDTCGTGGDGANTFNISTASAFVVAAAGAKVAKHGNRSVSSSCGSADVLEAAGVKLDLNPEQVARCVEEIGVGFMFALMHHRAMRHAIGPRKEMGTRTIFNLLGPLTNPATAPNQVLGVFDKAWVKPMAEVLQALGSKQVMVVHSQDGLDEISIGAPTDVAELKDGVITEYTLTPEEFGCKTADLSTLAVDSAEESLALINKVFGNEAGPALDIVLLNAGAAIYVSGIAATLSEGVEMARDSIGSGLAKGKLSELVSFTQVFNEG